jgi:hypothetical protein
MADRRESGTPSMTARRNERRVPETKSFILASEFWVYAVAVAAMLFAAYVIDDLRNPTAWRYGAFLSMAYIVSRGIAKAGSQRGFEPDRYRQQIGERSAESDWAERRSASLTETGRDVPTNR